VTETDDCLDWRKSSFSGTGDCLEWAVDAGTVWVRDSKDRSGPKLALTWSEWGAFIRGVRSGEGDLPAVVGRP
jgi:hypothetical protein